MTCMGTKMLEFKSSKKARILVSTIDYTGNNQNVKDYINDINFRIKTLNEFRINEDARYTRLYDVQRFRNYHQFDEQSRIIFLLRYVHKNLANELTDAAEIDSISGKIVQILNEFGVSIVCKRNEQYYYQRMADEAAEDQDWQVVCVALDRKSVV